MLDRYFSILLSSWTVILGSEEVKLISMGFPLGGPALKVLVSTLIPGITEVSYLISEIIVSAFLLLSQSLNSISINPIISGELSCLFSTFPDVV